MVRETKNDIIFRESSRSEDNKVYRKMHSRSS